MSQIEAIKTAVMSGVTEKLESKASTDSVQALELKNEGVELQLKALAGASDEVKNLVADLQAKIQETKSVVPSNEPLQFNMKALNLELKSIFALAKNDRVQTNLANVDTKALTIGSGNGEALAIDEELGRTIIERARENVAILGLIASKTIGSTDYREMVLRAYPETKAGTEQTGNSGTAPGDIWALTATATYEGVSLNVGKQYAKPIISNEAIKDPHIDIYAHLVSLLAEEMSRYWALQVIYGNGTGDNLRGLLSTSRISAVESVKSNAIRDFDFYPVELSGIEDSIGDTDPTAVNSAIDNAIDLTIVLPSAYLAGAMFTMNRRTLGAYRKLKDLEGRPLIQFESGSFSLVGYGVTIEDYMPDINGTNPASYALADMRMPVIFGQLSKAYALCHIDDNFLVDPYSADGGVMLKYESRKGDIVQHNDAIVVFRTDSDFS